MIWTLKKRGRQDGQNLDAPKLKGQAQATYALNLITKPRQFSNGVRHIELRCVNDHHIKFLPQNNPNFAMPFGKFRGLPIRDLPDDYLSWMLENAELKNNIRRRLETEYEKRGGAV